MDFFVILANVGEARLDSRSEQWTIPPPSVRITLHNIKKFLTYTNKNATIFIVAFQKSKKILFFLEQIVRVYIQVVFHIFDAFSCSISSAVVTAGVICTNKSTINAFFLVELNCNSHIFISLTFHK